MSSPATSLECITLGSEMVEFDEDEGRSQGVMVSSAVKSSWTTYLSEVRVRVIFNICQTNSRKPGGPYNSIFG